MRARGTADKPCGRPNYHRHQTFVCVKDKKLRACKYGRSKNSGKCRSRTKSLSNKIKKMDKSRKLGVAKKIFDAIRAARTSRKALAPAPAPMEASRVTRRSTRLMKN